MAPATDAGEADASAAADAGGTDAAQAGTDAGGDPNCSSGRTVNVGSGASMDPGANCLRCHGGWVTGGTVMGALHDVDNCAGVGGVTIEITDANNQVTTLTSNSVGNFYRKSGSIATPYTVKVMRGGNEATMTTPTSNLACNNCHTRNGANGAAGRIVAP